ncbi:MAG: 50S ribosomal protein L15 [Acidimicrobiia bacterium]|nr:50S ribosomal protein L15 [Acidimicrobiia bacterium]
MKLHHLRPAEGSKKRKIRVGRGEAGRRGKTAGRGTKGLKARSKVRQGFEGGQTPLQRRIPKLKGFKNPNREEFTVINVGRLGELDTGTTVTPETMRAAGLAKKRGKIKVLGEGDINVALTVKAHAFSAGAAGKIQSAGGSIEVIES